MQLYFRIIGFMQYRLRQLKHKTVPLSSTNFRQRRMVFQSMQDILHVLY